MASRGEDSVGGPRVLRVGVADDDRGLRWLLTSAVERLGHEVVCAAADGEQFLCGIAGKEIDLAILDLDMPEMDGLAAAEEVVRQRNIPVILVSGHVDLDHVVVGSEPVEVVIQKPISIEALAAAIEQVAK